MDFKKYVKDTAKQTIKKSSFEGEQRGEQARGKKMYVCECLYNKWINIHTGKNTGQKKKRKKKINYNRSNAGSSKSWKSLEANVCVSSTISYLELHVDGFLFIPTLTVGCPGRWERGFVFFRDSYAYIG